MTLIQYNAPERNTLEFVPEGKDEPVVIRGGEEADVPERVARNMIADNSISVTVLDDSIKPEAAPEPQPDPAAEPGTSILPPGEGEPEQSGKKDQSEAGNGEGQTDDKKKRRRS